MPSFSRRTILAALDTLQGLSHSAISRYMLERGLEDVVPSGEVHKQADANELGCHIFVEKNLNAGMRTTAT